MSGPKLLVDDGDIYIQNYQKLPKKALTDIRVLGLFYTQEYVGTEISVEGGDEMNHD